MPVEVGVQKKDCRPHYPVRNDTDPSRPPRPSTADRNRENDITVQHIQTQFRNLTSVQNTSIPSARRGGTGGPGIRRCGESWSIRVIRPTSSVEEDEDEISPSP